MRAKVWKSELTPINGSKPTMQCGTYRKDASLALRTKCKKAQEVPIELARVYLGSLPAVLWAAPHGVDEKGTGGTKQCKGCYDKKRCTNPRPCLQGKVSSVLKRYLKIPSNNKITMTYWGPFACHQRLAIAGVQKSKDIIASKPRSMWRKQPCSVK